MKTKRISLSCFVRRGRMLFDDSRREFRYESVREGEKYAFVDVRINFEGRGGYVGVDILVTAGEVAMVVLSRGTKCDG